VAEIEFIEVEAVSAIAIRRTCNFDELAKLIPELFGQISLSNPEAEMIGPPMLKYYDWTPPTCIVEAACPVASGTKAGPGTEIREYPACTALFLEHQGPYEGLPQAWLDLWKFAEVNGVLADVPCWDTYVTDPGEEPDTSKWITELYIPIRKL
jgi:AraC family transcriptional regulator